MLWKASYLSFILKCNTIIPHTFICSSFSGLFPAVLNLASNALITTNATCGEKGPEMYCKLVEHVPGQPVRNPQCRICNQNSSNPYRMYLGLPCMELGGSYHWECWGQSALVKGIVFSISRSFLLLWAFSPSLSLTNIKIPDVKRVWCLRIFF